MMNITQKRIARHGSPLYDGEARGNVLPDTQGVRKRAKTLVGVVLMTLACLSHAGEEWYPPVTCHRGGYEYDDNALGSFRDSDRAGLKRMETDFRFTRDHRFVLMHDDTMDRTTTGSGYVEDHTLDELRALTLRRSGEKIPTGEELFAFFKGRSDVFLILELKTYNHKPGVTFYTDAVAEEFCRKLAALAKSNLPARNYVFNSTDVRSLRIMRRIYPEAPISMSLYDTFNDTWLQVAKDLKCETFAPWIGGLHPGDIDKIRAAGMAVELWPILTMGDYVRARKLGADAVCSDTPKEFMRRITMPQCAKYDYGRIRTAWDRTTVRIEAPRFSRVYKLTACGVEPLTYVCEGRSRLWPSDVSHHPLSDFSRCTAGCLRLGNEIGVRITVLTDDGEEQIDIRPSDPDVVLRKLPVRVTCAY